MMILMIFVMVDMFLDMNRDFLHFVMVDRFKFDRSVNDIPLAEKRQDFYRKKKKKIHRLLILTERVRVEETSNTSRSRKPKQR